MVSPSPALVIDEVAIGELRPDPFNPRRVSDAELDALTRSVQEFGLVDPIIARREDSAVIGGHQRLVAARRLGISTVPVIFLEISIEHAKLLSLALNRISGSWDQELLARLLADLESMPDVDLGLSGFADDEIAKLLKTLEAREKGCWSRSTHSGPTRRLETGRHVGLLCVEGGQGLPLFRARAH